MIDLVLLPFAGGTSLTYMEWRFSDSVNVIPLDYRGHGFRMTEPLYTFFEEMVNDVSTQIVNKRSNKRLCIFGHSMGALLGWDVLNDLKRKGVHVNHLFVSACLPPHLFNEKKYLEMASNNWLIPFLKKYSRIEPDRMKS